MCQSWLIGRHLSRHEYEAIEHHTPSYDWHVLQGLFEDDVNVTVHSRLVCVCHPPEV